MIVRFRASELYDNRVTDEDRRCQPLIVRRRYARRPTQWNEKRWGDVCPGGRVELTDEAWEWIMDKAKLGKRGGMVGMNHDHCVGQEGLLKVRRTIVRAAIEVGIRWSKMDVTPMIAIPKVGKRYVGDVKSVRFITPREAVGKDVQAYLLWMTGIR